MTFIKLCIVSTFRYIFLLLSSYLNLIIIHHLIIILRDKRIFYTLFLFQLIRMYKFIILNILNFFFFWGPVLVKFLVSGRQTNILWLVWLCNCNRSYLFLNYFIIFLIRTIKKIFLFIFQLLLSLIILVLLFSFTHERMETIVKIIIFILIVISQSFVLESQPCRELTEASENTRGIIIVPVFRISRW